LLHEFLIEIHAIGQEHISKGAAIFVVVVSLDGDFFPKGEVRGDLLGPSRCVLCVTRLQLL